MESIGDHRRHSGIQGVTCYELMDMDEASEGCSTPTRDEYKIHVGSAPPPPPRKKPAVAVAVAVAAGRKRAVPKNGYFQPPDLDSFFATCNCKLVHIICNN